MANLSEETMMFNVDNEESNAAVIIGTVYQALKEKGYNPINQWSDIFCPAILHILPVIIMLVA